MEMCEVMKPKAEEDENPHFLIQRPRLSSLLTIIKHFRTADFFFIKKAYTEIQNVRQMTSCFVQRGRGV